jgi:transposase-like protein
LKRRALLVWTWTPWLWTQLPGLLGRAAEAGSRAFGLSPSSVSRRYIRATARKLEALQERRLDRYDFVVLVIDGKTFTDDTMVIALGVTLGGEKVVLGFVQTGTENAAACAAFLRGLVERGLRVEEGLLVVVDGSKGFTGRSGRCSGRKPWYSAASGTSGRTW